MTLKTFYCGLCLLNKNDCYILENISFKKPIYNLIEKSSDRLIWLMILVTISCHWLVFSCFNQNWICMKKHHWFLTLAFMQFVYISTIFQFAKGLGEKFIMIVYVFLVNTSWFNKWKKTFLSSHFLAYSFWNKIWNFCPKIFIAFRE